MLSLFLKLKVSYLKNIKQISAIGDLIILNILFNLVFCYLNNFDQDCYSLVSVAFFIFINIIWTISAQVFNVNDITNQTQKKVLLFNTIKAVILLFFAFLIFFQVFSFSYYSRDNVKLLFVVYVIVLLVWKFLLHYFSLYYRKLGYNHHNVVIVGYNDAATDLKDYFIRNKGAGYIFKGFFTDKESGKKDVIGTLLQLEDFILNHNVHEIYIFTSEIHRGINKIISSIISKQSIKIRFVPDLSQFSYMSIKLVDYDIIPVIQIQQGPLNYWYNRLIKRLFDIIFSLFVIFAILSLFTIVLMVADLFIRREGVFFIQKRSGLNNRSFNIIKFRTMKINGDANIRQAIENDTRITKIGKFLRKYSLDELPQFYNVLIGKMSVIGPRPHMLVHTDEYKALVSKFMIRHAVKPGITGYAQVRGCRGEIKKIRDMKDRIKLDISYIENWSILLDLKIVYLTIVNLMRNNNKAN